MSHRHFIVPLPLLILGLLACGKDDAKTQPAPTPTATAAPKPSAVTAAPTATASAAPTAAAAAKSAAPAGFPGYPEEGFTKVPEGCKTPTVLLASAPVSSEGKNPYTKDKSGFPFHFARQALLAHPELKVVKRKADAWTDEPAGPNQVALSYVVDTPPMSVSLLGVCGDAATCNRLMAMYHRVVPSSKPQGMCGLPPQTQVYGTASTNFQADGAKSDMPSDVMGRCTRLAACTIRLDLATPGDPGLECQKAPAKFKLDCANKATCEEVVACAKK